eukprot:334135-Pelagomonas_calceolata.AAC.2
MLCTAVCAGCSALVMRTPSRQTHRFQALKLLLGPRLFEVNSIFALPRAVWCGTHPARLLDEPERVARARGHSRRFADGHDIPAIFTPNFLMSFSSLSASIKCLQAKERIPA